MNTRLSSRAGYSAVEIMVAASIFGLVAMMSIPSVGRTLAHTRLQRAASAMASDLQLAQTTAARFRAPIRVTVDPTHKVLYVQNHATPTTVYATRYFGAETEYAVPNMSVDVTSRVLYPNGLASGSMTITLTSVGKTRRVKMTGGGQVRISE